MWKIFAALALGLALAACDVSGLVPKEHTEFAKRVVTMVQTRDENGLQAVCDPALWQQLTPQTRAQMAAIFPNEQPTSVTVSSWKSNFNNDWSNVTMILLYKYSNQDIRATVGFRSSGNRNILTAIYVLPIGGATGSQPPPQQPQQPRDDKSTTL
jgi:hypothetical protein